MSTRALLLVLLSCVFHAVWNLASRGWRDVPGFVWGVVVWSGLWALLTLPWTAPQLAWGGGLAGRALLTGLGLGVYYHGVRNAYLHGEVAQVYPLIRSSPLWVTLLGIAFFGEQHSLLSAAGILLTVLGVFLLPLETLRLSEIRLMHRRLSAPAVRFALLAGLGTTLYTLSDKSAMSGAAGPFAATAWRALTVPLGLLAWRLWEGRAADRGFQWQRLSAAGVPTLITAASGFCLFAAFSLVITALQTADAGRVASATNFGVVLGSLAGILLLRERKALAPRLLGLALTVTGIILLRLP